MLSSELISEMIHYANSQAPNEMCGLLFSKDRFVWCCNSSPNPASTFELSHENYQVACHSQGEDPRAIVHSHPGKGAALSQKDCSLMDALQMANLNWDFIIVGMDPVEVRCWKKAGELYQLQWEWKLKPMDPETAISAAVSE